MKLVMNDVWAMG